MEQLRAFSNGFTSLQQQSDSKLTGDPFGSAHPLYGPRRPQNLNFLYYDRTLGQYHTSHRSGNHRLSDRALPSDDAPVRRAPVNFLNEPLPPKVSYVHPRNGWDYAFSVLPIAACNGELPTDGVSVSFSRADYEGSAGEHARRPPCCGASMLVRHRDLHAAHCYESFASASIEKNRNKFTKRNSRITARDLVFTHWLRACWISAVAVIPMSAPLLPLDVVYGGVLGMRQGRLPRPYGGTALACREDE